jgi:hypothetical protein
MAPPAFISTIRPIVFATRLGAAVGCKVGVGFVVEVGGGVAAAIHPASTGEPAAGFRADAVTAGAADAGSAVIVALSWEINGIVLPAGMFTTSQENVLAVAIQLCP